MARDGFVSWEASRYGVHWKWVGRIVRVGQRLGAVEIWVGDELIAVHPQGQRAGQHFILPGQCVNGGDKVGRVGGRLLTNGD